MRHKSTDQFGTQSNRSSPFLRHRLPAWLFQVFRSWQNPCNSPHVCPVPLSSAPRSRRHVFLCRLFSILQRLARLRLAVWCRRLPCRECRLQRLCQISYSAGTCQVLCNNRSLLIISRHYITWIVLRQMLSNVCILIVVVTVVLHVSVLKNEQLCPPCGESWSCFSAKGHCLADSGFNVCFFSCDLYVTRGVTETALGERIA